MIREQLKKIAQDLREAGETDLADGVCCVFAALTGEKKPKIDLTYSAACREIRKKQPNKLKPFQKLFKQKFDEALIEGLDDPEDSALMECLNKMELDV